MSTELTRNIAGRYIGSGPNGHSMKVEKVSDLPAEFGCKQCTAVKPIDDMCVVHLKREGVYYVRPRCKECHNEKEKGHRREYKREYLRAWRKKNRALNDSYWKDDPEVREKARINAQKRLSNVETHEATLIQGRLRRSLDEHVSMTEAKELLRTFGRCYPTRFGLTPEGLKECERIRANQRRKKPRFKLRPIEIRVMVYEDGLHIAPTKQPIPYESAAENLRRWHRDKRSRNND